MRVIALDPGSLTGWAAADIDDVGEWRNVEHGILPLKESALMLWAAQVPRPTYDVIVVEAWVLYRAHAEEYIGSEMPYSQLVGMFRFTGWASNTPVIIQPANRKNVALRQVRAFRPGLAEKIEDIEARAHKDGHDGDALLHLFGYTVDHFPIQKQARAQWMKSEQGRAVTKRYRESEQGRANARLWAFAARYGLTVDEARKVQAQKPDRCDICGATDVRLNYDHDHTTGKHRGWLCTNCNRGLSYLEQNGWIDRARRYLGEHT